MLLADACHLRGPIEDGDEVWVETVVRVGTALDGAPGAEEEDVCAEAGAEALRVGSWSEGGPRGGFEGRSGEVAAEEGEEGVGFRHRCGLGAVCLDMRVWW